MKIWRRIRWWWSEVAGEVVWLYQLVMARRSEDLRGMDPEPLQGLGSEDT